MSPRRLLVPAALLAALAGCATAPPQEDPALVRARSLAARAERDASEGRLRDALDGYREAVALAPGDAGFAARAKELQQTLVEGRMPEAQWRERILRDTRRYARRQETWFRREPGLIPVSATRPDLVSFAERLARPLFSPLSEAEGSHP